MPISHPLAAWTSLQQERARRSEHHAAVPDEARLLPQQRRRVPERPQEPTDQERAVLAGLSEG